MKEICFFNPQKSLLHFQMTNTVQEKTLDLLSVETKTIRYDLQYSEKSNTTYFSIYISQLIIAKSSTYFVIQMYFRNGNRSLFVSVAYINCTLIYCITKIAI
jgi:uncharacterized membrane protein YwaF